MKYSMCVLYIYARIHIYILYEIALRPNLCSKEKTVSIICLFLMSTTDLKDGALFQNAKARLIIFI